MADIHNPNIVGTMTGNIPGGGGDVLKVGTPVDQQVGIWTGDPTIKGDAEFTFSGTQLNVGVSGAGTLVVGAAGTGSISSGAGQTLIVGAGLGGAQTAIRGPQNNAGNGGLTQVQGGYSPFNAGGDVWVSGGSTGASSSDDGGDVVLTPGFAQGSGTDGKIILERVGVSGHLAPKLCFAPDYGGAVRYTELRGAGDLVATTTWTLPKEHQSTVAGKFITSDGSGNWSFSGATWG